MSAKGIGPLVKTLPSLQGVDLIRQDILNLLQTRKGDRPFRANLGVGFLGFLFEPADRPALQIIKASIREQLTIFEPRVQILDLDVVYPDLDQDIPTAVIVLRVRLISDPTFTDILRIPIEGVGGDRYG